MTLDYKNIRPAKKPLKDKRKKSLKKILRETKPLKEPLRKKRKRLKGWIKIEREETNHYYDCDVCGEEMENYVEQYNKYKNKHICSECREGIANIQKDFDEE